MVFVLCAFVPLSLCASLVKLKFPSKEMGLRLYSYSFNAFNPIFIGL
jgi:hypothetical protein